MALILREWQVLSFSCSEELEGCAAENCLPPSKKTPGQWGPNQKFECLSSEVPVCSLPGPHSLWLWALKPMCMSLYNASLSFLLTRNCKQSHNHEKESVFNKWTLYAKSGLFAKSLYLIFQT